MRIGEYWASDDEKPVVDGDTIRNLLVLGPVSVNAADAFRGKVGKLAVKRKFHHVIGEQSSLFDGVEGHLGPHRFVGEYPTTDRLGKFVNPRATDKGLRMDLIGESSLIQFQALKDHIEHDRPFGGFSPLMDGSVNLETGETTISAVKSIDWVPNSASVKSIAESEAEEEEENESYEKMAGELDKLKSMHEELGKSHEELAGKHEKLGEEHEALKAKHEDLVGEHHKLGEEVACLKTAHAEHEKRIGESETAIESLKTEKKEAEETEKPAEIAESIATPTPGGARTEPIPKVTPVTPAAPITNLFSYIRQGK